MAHYDDFDGAYFTIQDIRKELVFNNRGDLLSQIEFVIVDNNPESKHGDGLKKFSNYNIPYTSDVQYYKFEDNFGTSSTRDKVIEIAKGDFVLVMDCHVLLCPVVDVIVGLFDFMEKNKETDHLYSGPLVHDCMLMSYTHFNDEWDKGMWGKWASAFSCKNCGFNFSPMISGPKKPVKYVSLVEQQEMDKCSGCGLALPEIHGYKYRIVPSN